MKQILTRLTTIALARGDGVLKARAVADVIRRTTGSYHWVGLYDVTPTDIVAIGWTGHAAPAFPGFPKTQDLNGAAAASRTPIIVQDVARGYRPVVFDDIPIAAIITMESVGTGTRYVFTALHRDEADLEKNKASGFYQATEIAVDQFVAHVKSMK